MQATYLDCLIDLSAILDSRTLRIVLSVLFTSGNITADQLCQLTTEVTQ